MSTTYYTVKKLTKEEKEKVIKAINDDSYEEARDLLAPSEREEIGHRAGGWKFSWFPYNKNFLSLTREGIIELVNRDDILIYNEYGEIEDKEEFLKMAFEWYPEGYTSNTYQDSHKDEHHWSMVERQERCKKLLKMYGYSVKPKFTRSTQTDFENDGLRWTILE